MDDRMLILTILALFAIGAISFYSIGLYNFKTRENPNWIKTEEHVTYMEEMNNLVYPCVIVLIVVLGMCIPRRVVPRPVLKNFSIGLLGVVFLFYAFGGLLFSLGFLLGLGILIQSVSLLLTLIKKGRLAYEKKAYSAQLGSAFLHLGIVVLLFDLALMQGHAYHIHIFWASTALLTLGMLMSFYGKFP
jgi:hypothetical protein